MLTVTAPINKDQAGLKLEQTMLSFGQAGRSKKGEDFFLIKTDCKRTDSDDSTFSVFAIFDGHLGSSAAIYSRDNILKNVLGAIPPRLSRQEWLAALPLALVAGFVKTDKEFQNHEQSSGTTVTFVVVDGWTVTVASVGDSRCIVEFHRVISFLTVDHRLDDNEEERLRIESSGGVVRRLVRNGDEEVGPLRCWPGGLCLSRSIGDLHVGEIIVPIPFVKQIKLSVGGRIIIASDGVWDALSSEKVTNCCKGSSAKRAANQIVDESLRDRGLMDDTTCLVVDVKNGSLASIFKTQLWKFSCANRVSDGGNLEEIFEEGSALLSKRLGSGNSWHELEQLVCAVCQVGVTSSERISVHATSSSSTTEGPFLCVECKQKQDRMEGREA